MRNEEPTMTKHRSIAHPIALLSLAALLTLHAWVREPRWAAAIKL